jgi:hypothetical protein
MRPWVAALAIVVLASAAASAEGAVAPSSGRCAGAWNTTAPAALRRAVVRANVWQATVAAVRGTETTITQTSSGSTTSRRAVTRCMLMFFGAARHSLLAAGTWQDGRVLAWNIRTVAKPPGSGNACVSRAGRISAVGPFTAAQRCRP